MDVNSRVAAALKLEASHVETAAALIKEGFALPFIAHYRKDRTGGMDESKLAALKSKIDEFSGDETRRETALKSISDGGKLTPELEEQLKLAQTRDEIEDLYMAFRSRRRTRSSAARHKGLEPLANLISKQESGGGTPDEIVLPFINEEKQVKTAQEALAGARDIIAERIAEDPACRKIGRDLLVNEGKIVTKPRENVNLTKGKYSAFAAYSELLSKVPGYRVLTAMRGAADKQLYLTLEAPREKVLEQLKAKIITNPDAPLKAELALAIEESYERLLGPSLDNDLRLDLKSRAEGEAIDVFAKNLRAILLQAPLGAKPVLALCAAVKAPWKMALVASDGKAAATLTLHPGKDDEEKKKAAEEIVKALGEHNVAAIAIANNSGAKDADHLVRETLAASDFKDLPRVLVHEGAASAFAGSAHAREELSALDNISRTAVSLGRRLQDPLVEILKLELKTIPLGQYQHDVDQALLARRLEEVARGVVALVGVDLNAAGEHVLQHVPGLNADLAKAIVAARTDKGAFKSREDLKLVPGIDAKTFEQCAAFLRIPGAENKLDATSIHPEAYATADAAVIEAQLKQSDPRGEFVKPEYNDDVKELADLKPGMTLNGCVTNLAQFGAFVDVGVHQDGLVHLSAITHKFIHDPSEVLTVGQRVKVKVLSIDADKKRISLSMKALEELPKRPARAPRGPRRENATGTAVSTNVTAGAEASMLKPGERPGAEGGARRPRRFDRNRGPRTGAPQSAASAVGVDGVQPLVPGGESPAAAHSAHSSQSGAPRGARRDGTRPGGERRGPGAPSSGSSSARGPARGPSLGAGRAPDRKPGQPDFSKFFVKSKRKEREKTTRQDGGASREDVREVMKQNHTSGTSLADLLKQAGLGEEK